MDKTAVPTIVVEDDRTGLSVETLTRAVADNLFYVQGKFQLIATRNDWYMALAYTVRDRLLHRWIATLQTCMKKDTRLVCYLSAEFLMGPHLGNNLINLDIWDLVDQAVSNNGQQLSDLIEQEEEPGLGNGGLGRLAACYMDSLASLNVPAIGYGIRYEFGIFDQLIRDGWQVEITDKWLHFGNPWEIARPERNYEVNLGGTTEAYIDAKQRYRVRWHPNRVINGIPYDTPILGFKTNTTNTLRLWKAEAPESFDFQAFNTGDYIGAVHQKMVSENISKVLYPNDDQAQGRQLRLEQQYFFVSCSLQDVINIHFREGDKIETLHKKVVFQLNDTHPSIAVAEMMRLLIDVHELNWDTAWDMTTKMFAYTNHTLLPEALERWSLPLFASVLPRHLEIIFEINRRFLDMLRDKYPGDNDRLRRMSIIDENGDRYVRMANLACVGSHAINGVAALHSDLLKSIVLKDFYELWPEKFLNVTNGVTPRRWMLLSNPRMSTLISKSIGNGWVSDLDQLRQLEKFAEDKDFRKQWREIKRATKTDLAEYIQHKLGITVDPASLFDVQVKRMHEYKRQHLNVLHIITLYNQIKQNPKQEVTPRTFIFGGKAAPGYFMAKLMIKLINSVAEVVNNDKDVNGRLKVIFLPDFNVTLGQRVYPAADLSEQISTAGKEASGTGNMKFALNGALTIGTLDGANIEMREEVGADNFFLFGLTAEQVMDMKAHGYNPRQYYDSNTELKQVIDQLAGGHFSRGDSELFRPIVDNLLNRDDYMLLADYQSYIDCQKEVSAAYRDEEKWSKMSILNVARMGKFSSDRSIEEYCEKIWDTEPIEIKLDK
jgi:starch phosphorylase